MLPPGCFRNDSLTLHFVEAFRVESRGRMPALEKTNYPVV